MSSADVGADRRSASSVDVARGVPSAPALAGASELVIVPSGDLFALPFAALRDRDDTQALGLSAEEKKKAPPNRKRAPPDAAGVLRQFCYDFPDASADDCGALAAALRTPAWRGDHRVSARAARGIACLARDKKSGAGAANATLAPAAHLSPSQSQGAARRRCSACWNAPSPRLRPRSAARRRPSAP